MSMPICKAFLSKGGVCKRTLATGKLVIVKGRKGNVDPQMTSSVGHQLCVPGCPTKHPASRDLGITMTATVMYTRFEELTTGS